MQIEYTVHSSNPTPVEIEADFNGAKVSAVVQGFVVELVSNDGTMSHTLKAMPGPDADNLATNFPVGKAVTATFTPVA